MSLKQNSYLIETLEQRWQEEMMDCGWSECERLEGVISQSGFPEIARELKARREDYLETIEK